MAPDGPADTDEGLPSSAVRPQPRRQSSAPASTLQNRSRPRSRSTSSQGSAQAIGGSSVLDCLNIEVPARLGGRRNVEGLFTSLLGSIVEVEQDLKALETETDEEDDSGDEDAGLLVNEEPGPRKTPLTEFIEKAREYVNHVKSMELPDLGLRPSARLAEMRQVVAQADPYAALPLRDIDISHFIERITRKLERVQETLTVLVSTSTATSPKSAPMPLPTTEAAAKADSVAPTTKAVMDVPILERPALSRRYTLTTLYASVPSLPSMPSPFPAIRASLVHEAIRLTHMLQPKLLRRPSFAHLPDEFDEIMSRAKQNFEHFAGEARHGIGNLAGEAKKEFDLLFDEAERMKNALREGTKRLLRYDELPEAWKSNPHIHSGYRFIPIERWGALLGSTFQWHNETVNVWSHALGAASLVYGICCIHPSTPQGLSPYPIDGQITLVFLYTAIACLTCSAIWHLFSGCGTSHVFNSCACLDYVGISSLITGSIVSLIYYGFYCEPELAKWYIAFSLSVGVAGIIFPWQAWFNETRHKGTRIAFFLALCGSAAVPQTHMALKYGILETIKFYSPVTLSVMAYIAGLTLYACNFPERLRPGGLFDTVAHSHQFWHVAIVAAVYLHWWATGELHKTGTTGFSCAVR